MLFGRYVLRTTDVDAAVAFYSQVLGWQAQRRGSGGVFVRRALAAAATPTLMAELEPLPERARSLGAPAHWLGLLAVPDLDAATQRWIQAGALARGPVQPGVCGDLQALRDPQGAAIGLCPPPVEPAQGVAFHQLHVPDAESAFAAYAALVGWQAGPVSELGAPWGTYRTFRARDDEPPQGAVLSNAGTPQVHAQWLFFFAVDDLAAALQRLRSIGGQVAYEASRADGTHMAVCEDGQGAAFALHQATTERRIPRV